MDKKKEPPQGSPKKSTPPARKRVSFSISSDPDTVEGRIVNHLRDNKMVNMREAVIRALKAYYLPWAYEDEVSKEETQVLARNAIDELEFRIFQIRRHFLAGEAYGPKLSESLGGSPISSHGNLSNGHGSNGNGNGTISHEAVLERLTPSPPAPKNPTDTNPTSLTDILEDEDIDPDVLDDF